MKIALIIVYFGKFKSYFPLFLSSCAKNPDVNWFIFTDQDYDKSLIPENVFFVKTTFEEVKQRISNLYDFEIDLQTPYDMCDYKVTYGEAFADYLQDYDFWGYCDCDLVFGDIRAFVTDELLNQYDKLFTHGHFTLFRNTKEITALYRSKISDGTIPYKGVFQSPGIHHFDEGRPELLVGINRIFMDNIGWDKVYECKPFMDLYVNQYNFINFIFINTDEEQMKAKNSFFLYDNGKLYRVYADENSTVHKEEFMYIHFQKRNMKYDFAKPLDKYCIIPNRFCEYKGESQERKFIKSANKKRFYWELNLNRVKRKLKKILGAK